jgi:hypothetical protein
LLELLVKETLAFRRRRHDAAHAAAHIAEIEKNCSSSAHLDLDLEHDHR